MEAAEAALQHGGRTGDVFVQIWSLVELATITFMAGEVAEAEDWLSAADHLLRNGDLKPEQRRSLDGRALGVRGMCLATRGSADEARQAFENGEHLLSALGPSRELAIIQQNFGSFCNRIGDFHAAQGALALAASHWRVVGDRGRLAATHTILADMYLRLGNLDSAGESLASAQQAARHVGASRLEPWIILSLGQWHRACGRILDAVEATEEALRLGADSALAATDRALGRLHLADGASERAVSHLEAAVRRGSEVWSTDEQADALYWLGSAYLQLKRPQPALRCLEQALEIIEEAGRPALLAGAAAEDPRLVQHGLEIGLRPVMLGDVERIAATRRPWTGVKQPVPIRLVAVNALPRLEVQLFASFVFHRDGELVENRGRKKDPPRELLALLVLNRNGLPDEVIAEHMWPEMTPERALHNLQAAAYSLRHQLDSKAAVRFSAKTYQLNPQMRVHADVREFEDALSKARGSTGEQLVQALSQAVELYRDPLLADVAWRWVEPVRAEYRARFVGAALQLADLLANSDATRSDFLGESVLAISPETDMAYERLIQNARARRDVSAVRRLVKRYELAASQFGFNTNPRLLSAAH